jgi:hypothetical protein
MSPAAVQASSAPSPNWTRQDPAASPPGRDQAAMAYDAATGTVVLFGGCCNKLDGDLNGTWTWDGTTWAKQHPATSPPGRFGAAMAYDAATSTAVLFGGKGTADTWTWDGTTWTQQAPAASPPARYQAAMAYDSATGTAVLFGGKGHGGVNLGDTWTWG